MTGHEVQTVVQRKQTLNIIWLMLTATVGLYWYVQKIVGPREPSEWTVPVVSILAVAAFAQAVGSWWLSRRMLSTLSQQIDGARLTQAASDPTDMVAQRLQAVVIISLALFEAIMICGVVAVFIGSPYSNTFEWFAAAALVNLVMYRVIIYPTVFGLLDKLHSAQRLG